MEFSSQSKSPTYGNTCVDNVKEYLILLHYMGLFSCDVHDGRLVPARFFGSAFCILWLLYSLTISVHSVYDILDGGPLKTVALLFALLFPDLVCCFATCAYQHSIDFFDKLLEYDDKCRKIGYERADSRRLLWFTVAFGVLYFLFTLTMSILSVRSSKKETKLIIHVYNIVQAVMWIARLWGQLLKFLLEADMLRQRFCYINYVLLPNVAWGEMLCTVKSVSVGDVRELYECLYEASSSFQRMHGGMITANFLCTVTNMFLFVNRFPPRDDIGYIYAVWLIFGYTAAVCVLCHLVTYEAKRVGILLTRGRLILSNLSVIKDRLEMAVSLLHTEVVFTGAGFFVVNMQLIATIVALLVSYCVFLIQA